MECTNGFSGKLAGFRIKVGQSRYGQFIAVGVLSLCTFMQSFFINGLVVSVETTLERRFDLKSSQVAWIVSAFHLIQGIVQLPVTHFAKNGKAPCWIGIGMLSMGVFSMLLAVPHFTASNYEPGTELETTCAADLKDCVHAGEKFYLIYFVFIQVLAGIANLPLFSLGLIYIRRSTSQTNAPLCIGVFFSGAVVGGACGYLVGGGTLSIFTNIGTSPGFSEKSSLWVGAWWLGFLVCGVAIMIVAIPVLFLPEKIHVQQPPPPYETTSRNSDAATISSVQIAVTSLPDSVYHESNCDVESSQRSHDKFSATVHAAFSLLRTKKHFTLLVLILALDYGSLAGVSTFVPKYFQMAFGFSASKANFYVGAATISGSLAGFLGSGFVVKRFELDRLNQFRKYLSLLSFLTLCGTFSFLLQCSGPDYAGVTTNYRAMPPTPTDEADTCVNHCHCGYDHFQPICGEDMVTYFSPCFAGCTGDKVNETFIDCKCLVKKRSPGWAKLEECKRESICSQAYVFVCIFAVVVLLHTASLAGNIKACMRESSGSLEIGVGVMWTLIRLIGMFPFPLIYGAVFQNFCLLWSTKCGENAFCQVYNSNSVNLGMVFLGAGQKLISLLLLGISYRISCRERS